MLGEIGEAVDTSLQPCWRWKEGDAGRMARGQRWNLVGGREQKLGGWQCEEKPG